MTDHGISAPAQSAQEPKRGQTKGWKDVFSLREMGVYFALAILVIVLAITTAYMGRSNYLSIQNVSNVLYQASLTSIIAVAMGAWP